MEANALADGDFRIVATLPWEVVSKGITDYNPLNHPGTLLNFDDLPMARDEHAPDSVFPADTWSPYLHFETQPIALASPGGEARLREVLVRGVFQRHRIKTTLYGAWHRDRWLPVASGGACLRGISGVSFPWYKLEIETPMRCIDFIDAIDFSTSPNGP